MRHIFIGQEEVRIEDVVAVLKESSEFDHLSQHYINLLMQLKLISGTNESTLDMCLVLLQSKGTAGAITDILDEWVRKRGTKAQLLKFIAIISNLQLYESASLLQNKFFDLNSKHYNIFVDIEAAEMQNTQSRAFERKDTESDVFITHSKIDKTLQLRNRFPKRDARSPKDPIASQNASITIIHCLPNAWEKIDVLLRETFKPNVGNLSIMGTRARSPEVLNISTGATKMLTVSSYIEYQKGLLSITNDAMLEVHINLRDTDSWPNDAFQNAGSIQKLVLEGKMETHKILYMLEKTSNLVEFELVDSSNGLCSNIERTQSIIVNKTNNLKSHFIVLHTLHTLKFTNFGSCGSAYKLFVDHVHMSNLSSLHQTNSLVDSKNVAVIQEFLRIHANSITVLTFSKTKYAVSLHDQNFPKLPNVSEIHIDLNPSSSCPDLSTIITPEFRNMYPNVQIFTSNNGCIHLDHLPRILESSILHSITTGVQIPSNMESVKIGFLKNYDYSLHFVEMYLFFPNKTSTDECIVEGLGLVKEKIKILLDANCSIK